MTDIFIAIINMSINAVWLFLAVAVFRLIFKNVPKYLIVLLWGLVALRLILPFSFETALSVIPSAQTVPEDIVYSDTPMLNSGISFLNSSVNPIIAEHFAPNPINSVNPLQVLAFVAANLWILGVIVMVIYAVISYFSVKNKVREAVILNKNIYLSDRIAVPFILGVFKPKIYIPVGINEQDTQYVIRHEQAHIKRKDYLWKPLGFLLLSIHWFNPFMWVAYVLLCKDIETACDQKVLSGEDSEIRKAYSLALINCSAEKRFITACPLAFGENGVKSRIKGILNYKKPAFWVSIAAIVLSVVLAVCFLTNPLKKRIIDINEPAVWITLLDNVTEYEFVMPYSSYSQNYIEQEDIENITKELLKVQISNSPISKSRDENRPKNNMLWVRHNESLTTINFNEDFTAVWLEDSVKPSFSYKVFNPQIVAELFEKYTQNVYNYTHTKPVATKGEKLTLNDVIELSKKGEKLGWADFEKFAYFETGSGLYIRQYEIDEMFYLLVGGTNTDEEVWYIYLAANDGLEEVIDIRKNDVSEYITKHIDNPVVTNLSSSFDVFPVGYKDGIYNKIIQKWGVQKYAAVSSIKSYTVTKISEQSQWKQFLADFEGIMDFDRSYNDCASLNSLKYQYTNEFFKYNDLVLVYVESENSALRYNVSKVVKSQNELRIGVCEIAAPENSETREGWLFAVRVFKADIGDVKDLSAIAISMETVSAPTNIYTFAESQDVIKPTLSLYENGNFGFTFSGISSYMGVGKYKITEDTLSLATDDGLYKYCFKIVGDSLVFDAENSSTQLHFSGLYDGAVMK